MQDPEKRLRVIPSAGGMPGHTGGHGGSKLRRLLGRVLGGRQSEMGEMYDNIPKGSVIDLEFLAPTIPLVEAHDQLGGLNGAFCYVYV